MALNTSPKSWVYSLSILVLAGLGFTGLAKAQPDAENQILMETIRKRFPVQRPTSRLHAGRRGEIVWSDREITFAGQDQARLKTNFKVDEAVFGRVYLTNSLANTPLISPNFDRPKANDAMAYEIRMTMNGRAVANRSNIFIQGQLRGKAGQLWTTWQFSPHPKGAANGVGRIGAIWQRSIRGLRRGSHHVRFDIWGVAGGGIVPFHRSVAAVSFWWLAAAASLPPMGVCQRDASPARTRNGSKNASAGPCRTGCQSMHKISWGFPLPVIGAMIISTIPRNVFAPWRRQCSGHASPTTEIALIRVTISFLIKGAC